MKTFKKKLYFRYLVSYTLVLLIPFIIFLTLNGSYFIHIYKNEVQNNNNNNLIQSMNALDTQFKQLDSLDQLMELDQTFSLPYLQNDYLRLSTYKKLFDYNFTNDFIFEILFYYRQDHTVFSSQGIHSETYAFGDLSDYMNWDKKTMLAQLQTVNEPILRPSEPVMVNGVKHQLISLIYPFRKNTSQPYATLIIQIDNQAISSILSASSQDDTQFYLFDKTGRQLFGTNGAYPYTQVSPFLHQPKLFDDITVHSLQAKNHIISYINSNTNGWVYVQTASVQLTLAKVRRLQQLVLLASALMLLLGSSLIYLGMRLNYQPLINLKAFLRKTIGSVPEGGSIIEITRNVIHDLTTINSNQAQKLKETSPSVKKDLLLKLLKGQFANSELFEFQLQSAGVNIAGRQTCVSVMKLPKVIQSAESENLIRVLENIDDPNIEMHTIEFLSNDRIIFLLISEQLAESDLKDFIFTVREEIFRQTNQKCFFGVGKTCSNPEDLYQSIIEANAVINSKVSNQLTPVLFYHGINQPSAQRYPTAEIEELHSALLDHQMLRFNENLNFLLNYIQGGQTSAFFSICLCYDMINVIIKTMNEIDPDFLEQRQYFTLADNIEFSTADELVNLIKKINDEINDFMKNMHFTVKKGTIDQIKEYIQQNLISPNFTLNSLADVFQMSTTNMSHYFKKQTGQNISYYVNTLRIVEAKKLLRNKDVSLEEVSQQIGYSSPSSFIRMFKQQVGCTPGEYRKLHM